VELTVADGQIVVATPAAVAGATAAPGAGAPAIKLPAAGLQASEPLTLEGTGTPGSTVTVYDGDEVVGQTVVAPDGTWEITLPPPAAGMHSLVAKQVGADGKEQAASLPVELTVADGQIVVATPAVVAEATAATGVATAVPSVAPVAGKAPEIKRPVAAALKAGEPVVLEGTGEPGTTVTLYDGDQVVAETVVAPDGTWTMTVPPLAAGTHSLAAKVLGAGGREQAASAPIELTVADGKIVVATPAVSAPMVSTPVGAGADAGATMTLEGTGAPGATVKVYDDDKLLGEATVGADGKWTMTMPTLAAGLHSLVAKLFGADGKEQATSQELNVTVSAGPGAKLSVLPAINPPPGGKLSAGGAAELSGTAAPGVLLKLFDGGNLVGEATADASGNWQMVVPQMDAGEHIMTVITYGTGGEVQASSKPLTVIVSEPEAATATGPAAVQPKIGWPPDGSGVVSARPLVAGQSFPRGVVRIYDGATLLGETIADANGYWSFRPSVALTAGEHVLTAVATSADGLTTAKAPPVTITVRSRAVTIPSWKPVAGAAPVVITPENGDTVHTVQPLFAGTAAPNSKVRLYDGDKVMGEAVVDADGRWTFRPTAPLAEGEHIIAVAPLNPDGSEGAAKDTVTITIASGLGSAPGGPGIIVDSTPASNANSRPVLTGQAPAGATIRVYDGDQLLGEVKSGPDGHWYYTPAAPLTAGDHVLRFEVVGADGRTVASTETPITVAAGAPSVKPPQITSPSQGQAAPGDVLSGTAPAGSQVQIYDGNTLIGGTTAGANGKWRFRLPANLTAGAHDIHVVAVDQTGLPVSQSKAAAIVVAPPRTLPVTGAAARD
jgi:nucleoid-associated protein YgaU